MLDPALLRVTSSPPLSMHKWLIAAVPSAHLDFNSASLKSPSGPACSNQSSCAPAAPFRSCLLRPQDPAGIQRRIAQLKQQQAQLRQDVHADSTAVRATLGASLDPAKRLLAALSSPVRCAASSLLNCAAAERRLICFTIPCRLAGQCTPSSGSLSQGLMCDCCT